MNDEIKYIGTFEEQNFISNTQKDVVKTKKSKKPNFKVRKFNLKLNLKISKTKPFSINRHLVFILLVALAIYWLKPITYIKNILEEKRIYYAQINENKMADMNFFESIIYISGIEYYSDCKDTMVMPADGAICGVFDAVTKGIDIACDEYGDNIYAAANGNVCEIGYNDKHGNYIILEHKINNKYIYTYYGNLSKINVSMGQFVTQNEPIANEGGNPSYPAKITDSSGHHLHFEVRKTQTGGQLNPYIFIQ